MDTNSLKAFSAVYECGSITKAAEKLYITPQGLSKTIAHLENELGEPLFSRTNRGVSPTRFATTLYPKARKISTMLDSIETGDEADAPETLRIGSTSGYLLMFIASFLKGFEETQPGIVLDVVEGSDHRVADLIWSGQVECGFIAGPVDRARFDAVPYSSHPYVLIVNRDDELAGCEKVGLADFEGRTIATIGEDFMTYNDIRERLSQANVKPEKIIEVAEISTAIELAAHGKALCIDSDFCAYLHKRDDLVTLPLDMEGFSWDIYFASRKGAPLGESASRFRDYAFRWRDVHTRGLYAWAE